MDISEFLIVPEIREGYKVVINLRTNLSVWLEKCKKLAIYNQFLKSYDVIISRIYSFPVYLPEICVLLSLDTVSKDIAKKLYKVDKDNNILLCSAYNYRNKENRIVSRGNLECVDLDYKIYELYKSNLRNDFYLTPSIIKNGTLVSPNRWFYISSSKPYRRFETFLNYNFGIIYIKKEDISRKKRRKIWLNYPVDLYEVVGGFVNFQPNGFVSIKPIPLHFIEDPSEGLSFYSGNKGDYFVSSLISFNNYSTSCDNASTRTGNVNIVEVLTNLVYTPYEILPLLFPLVVDDDILGNLLYRFSIRKETLRNILSRLNKFSPQDPGLVRVFEEFIREQNPLLNIKEQTDKYCVEIVNPVVIPFLIRKLKLATCEESSQIRDIKKILEGSSILEKIKRLDELSKSNQWYNPELRPIYGIDWVLKPRINVLRKYIKIYKDLTQQRSYDHSPLSKELPKFYP